MNTKTKRRIQAPVVADEEEKRIMPILPDDIIVNILFMLPVESICRFRCVCKYWCHKLLDVKDPNFIKSRRKHGFESEKVHCFSVFEERNAHAQYEFYMYNNITKSSVFKDDYYGCVKIDSPFKSQVVDDKSLERIDILSSCNGLVMMKGYFVDDSLWLWNPSTKESMEIVIPKIKYGQPKITNLSNVTYGFGYDRDTNDYKIVKATCYGYNFFGVYYGCQVQVYISSSHSWKTLPNIPYIIDGYRNKAEAIFVCGAFHWRARNLETHDTCILAFDIHGEKFREVTLTQQVYELFDNMDYRLHISLGVLQGCLCIILLCKDGSEIEVWMMKDYKVRESWTKLFIAQVPAVFSNPIRYVKILWEFKNGEVLLVTTTVCESNTCFFTYDLVSQKTDVTAIQHIPTNEKWNIVAYVENLVSLRSIGVLRKRPRTCTQGSRKSVRLANKAQLIGRNC
ncbi:F-box/kelch-repeat protein At3g06240-like [Papaver somniferum]|uniref:F-box/kelch-repeat protein At3g06240-like n=1 Tax=Papaver somniferum TaxID=3469 RepID=UPI000E6FB428|nr:F-box/kelch-repeat protein At3g06240-like [Papaver somniferum]